MDLVSTRNTGNRVNPATAISQGLSDEGGLFVPCVFPKFAPDEIVGLWDKRYFERAAFIAAPFLSGFTFDELLSYACTAYSSFPRDAAPIVSLDSKTHVLELFHGPTLAFKDFALCFLPPLIGASLKKTGIDKTAVVLVATSGDTGSAALEGFSGADGTAVCVFYPDGGVSALQRLQMTTQTKENLKVIGIRGNFDDAQSGVKGIFGDSLIRENLESRGYMLSSANSINWGRIVPQIAYYFSAYADLVGSGKINSGEEINVVVPTGNFGNILAAYYARKCGLPLGKLVCASNSNNVLTDFIHTGVYDKNRKFYTTVSPSMDILISSNLERFVFDLYEGDCGAVSAMAKLLSKTGRYEVEPSALAKAQSVLDAGCATDLETLETIRKTHDKYGYLCDTHTAVALNVLEKHMRETGDETHALVVATASPFKFADSVLDALNAQNTGNDFGNLNELARVSGVDVPHVLAALAKKEERHKTICAPNEMKDELLGWLADM